MKRNIGRIAAGLLLVGIGACVWSWGGLAVSDRRAGMGIDEDRAAQMALMDRAGQPKKKTKKRPPPVLKITVKPDEAKLGSIHLSAKGTQELATIYSGTLQLLNWFSGMGAVGTTTAVSVASCGASCAITVTAFTEGKPHEETGEEWRGQYLCIAVTASAPGTTDTENYCLWLGDVSGPPQPQPDPPYTVIESLDALAWTISLSGAYRRAEVTQSLPSGQSGLRHPAQRTGTGAWYADADTTVTATVGTATATGNYGAGSETDITADRGLALSIAYSSAPATGTDYGIITANYGSGGSAVAMDFSKQTFYKDADSDGDWVWRGTTYEPGYSEPLTGPDVYWYSNPSGNSIGMRRGAGGSGGETLSFSTVVAAVQLHLGLWKQNRNAFGVTGGYYPYGAYDDSAGDPFDAGLYKHYISSSERETDADVSLAPGEYTYWEQWTFGITVPDDIWRVFTNYADGTVVKLRADWLNANSENVAFTDPLTTDNMAAGSLTDIRQPVTFHDLVTDLSDPPWQGGWITWARREINLDKPPGTSNTRPSDWTGSGGATVLGETWTIPAGGGTIERTLATRRRNRIIRFAAHVWPDPAEVSHDYPLFTRANLDIGVSGDDPNWWDPEATPHAGEEVGCTYEDVTDWRHMSCVQLTVTGATEDLPIQLRLTYRTLLGSDPNYLGATYNFGSEGEAEAYWSAQATATISATLSAATGKAKFDLAPDYGESPLDLELVEKVEIIFPASAQTLTFSAWETVPYDASNPVGEVRMRIAHLHETDYWGAETSVDGMPNYKPSYLYTMDTERVEVGYKSTQPQQHNPDYTGDPDDPTYLKTLARWYNEQTYAETLEEPTWDQTTIDGDLQDEDEVDLATPVWGDYDEDGFCLHVGCNKDVGTPYRTVFCDTILQGGVRGIAKDAGTRQVNQPTDAVSLEYSDDGGETKTVIRTCGTGYAGEYRTGAGREKAPRTYYVNGISLGGFVNVEEAWAAILIMGPYKDPRMVIDPGGVIYGVFVRGNAVRTWMLDAGGDYTALTPLFEGRDPSLPDIAICDDGRIVVCATVDGSMEIAESRDGGNSWQVMTTADLGSGLESGGIRQLLGELYLVGWDSDALWLALSSEPDYSREEIADGVSLKKVCDCVVAQGDDPPKSDVEVTDSGAIVVCVTQGDGMQIWECRDLGAAFAMKQSV